MTPDDFYGLYVNRAIDQDKVTGIQCVDLWKLFNQIIGYRVYPAGGDGYADNYVTNPVSKANILKNCREISILTQLQDGDWCYWRKGSPSCPYSHVAMFRKEMEMDQGFSSFRTRAGLMRLLSCH